MRLNVLLIFRVILRTCTDILKEKKKRWIKKETGTSTKIRNLMNGGDLIQNRVVQVQSKKVGGSGSESSVFLLLQFLV